VIRELSKVEQRYDAVVAVVRDGLTVTEVAAKFGVHRDTVYVWMARYEADGLDGLAERSHRPHRPRCRCRRRSRPRCWSGGGCGRGGGRRGSGKLCSRMSVWAWLADIPRRAAACATE
jgi:hypothetical protein